MIYHAALGDPKNPCIIFIIGIGGQLTNWPKSFTQELANKGFYVITFDNRDSGLSRHYDELGKPNFAEFIAAKQQGKPYKLPYTLQDMAQDVVLLMDKLEVKKAHIAGASMGGIIAQYVAIKFKDRVNSLICIASTSGEPLLPPPTPEVQAFFETTFNQANEAQGHVITKEEVISRKLKLFEHYFPNDFDKEKIKKELLAAYEREPNANGFPRQLLAMISAEPRTNDLKALDIPALIIHGDSDRVFPLKHGEQLKECFTNSKSQLEIIPKMGHGISEKNFSTIANLIVNFEKNLDLVSNCKQCRM